MYLQLGRPKDLIKAFLNLLIGFIIIIKYKIIDVSLFAIFFCFTTLVIIYVLELFSSRWHQLTDKEKNKLTTFLEFKNNLSKTLEAFNLVFKNLINPFNFLKLDKGSQNMSTKKWVRNDKNDNIKA